MKKLPIYTLITGFLIVPVGAFFKVMKYDYADTLLAVGMLLSFGSLVAIIYQSTKNKRSQKV
jgi:hypothetical protein